MHLAMAQLFASTVPRSHPNRVASGSSSHAVTRISSASPRSRTFAATLPARSPLSGRQAITCAAAPAISIADAPSLPVVGSDGQLAPFPAFAGVYAVYDEAGTLQYVGISRKVNISVATHLEALPELVASVKILEMPEAGKEELTEAWKEWIQGAVEQTGTIPPGNAPGEKMWQQRRPKAAKPEIRLTPGKGVADLTCSLEDLIDQVVKSNRVVAFIKGTRTEPACGFSHKVLTILSEVAGQDFEVVNVLDEIYNPGLRDAIKTYSQWPTIPQLFVDGEFMGGADIVEQMHGSGELRGALKRQ